MILELLNKTGIQPGYTKILDILATYEYAASKVRNFLREHYGEREMSEVVRLRLLFGEVLTLLIMRFGAPRRKE